MGSHFLDVSHIRVARIDVHIHRHLVAAFNLSGVPSFTLFPRGPHRAAGLPFTSPRSAAALIQFTTSPAVATLQAEVKATELRAARATSMVSTECSKTRASQDERRTGIIYCRTIGNVGGLGARGKAGEF